jgi:nucleoid DNA-binding protein
MKVNHATLIMELAERTNIRIKDSRLVIREFINILNEHFDNLDTVYLDKLGIFYNHVSKARIVDKKLTGKDTIMIAPRNYLKFRQANQRKVKYKRKANSIKILEKGDY